ncbi:MAG: c-type cytochrome domain-containing protein, partial [Gemmatimonadaceae bacterium]
PVALLSLAALLEVASAAFRPFRPLRSATGVVLLLGAVSAAFAAAAGTLLALGGGYDNALLASHQRFGIVLAIIASLATLLYYEAERRQTDAVRRGYRVLLGATVVLVVLAGERGGSLTYGPRWMTEKMPRPLAALAAFGGFGAPPARIANVDSARVYDDLVAPILAQHCTSCHGAAKAEGGLRMHTAEALLKGGDDDPAIVPGDPEESDLLRRVTLPSGHDHAMPPGGRPLGVGEIEVIRWWIANGASTTQRVGEVEAIPTSVATELARRGSPRERRRTGLYAIEAGKADERAVAMLRKGGLEVDPVAEDLSLLQVTAVNIRSAFNDEWLRRLLPVSEQITWLDLSGTQVTDAGLVTLARMPNLTRLSLGNTTVGDAGLQHLAGLAHLEYLNLYGTRVSDSGLGALRALVGLRVLYISGTQVTLGGQASLQGNLPHLRVFGGAAR